MSFYFGWNNRVSLNFDESPWVSFGCGISKSLLIELHSTSIKLSRVKNWVCNSSLINQSNRILNDQGWVSFLSGSINLCSTLIESPRVSSSSHILKGWFIELCSTLILFPQVKTRNTTHHWLIDQIEPRSIKLGNFVLKIPILTRAYLWNYHIHLDILGEFLFWMDQSSFARLCLSPLR